MSEIELHRGTPFLNSEELNRIARQQELSVVIAKARIFDQICHEVELDEEIEAELIQTFLRKEMITNDSELEDYLSIRGWEEDDLIYIATKAERLRHFQEQVFSQEVELNYLGHKIDIDQVSYTIICTQDEDEAFELHQRLQENEARPEEIRPINTIKNTASIATGRYGPQPISSSHPSLIPLLRVGHSGQLWHPFFNTNSWIILMLNLREGIPLDDNLYSELLDNLFENWLHEQISHLLTGQKFIELPRFCRANTSTSQPETKEEEPSKNSKSNNQSILQSQNDNALVKTKADNKTIESAQTIENKEAVEKWLLKSEIYTQKIIEDPITEWHKWLQSKCNISRDSVKIISLEDIYSILSKLFPKPQNIKPKLQTFENVLWIRNSGGLFDSQTGMVIPGTYLCRFPRQRQHPHLDRTWSELIRPINSYPSIENCIFIPFANGRNFGHFATETVAFLWPYLITDGSEENLQKPILLNECSPNDKFISTINMILNRCGSIPMYDSYLPNALHLKKVLVPEPSLSLQAYVADIHADAGQAMGDIILTNKSENIQLPKGTTEKIYISRSLLPSTIRKVYSEEEIEAHLKDDGWYIFHPQKYTLETQIRVYRHAKALAGFEGSALHCMNFLGNVGQQKTLIILGDYPSVDYFLQFMGQNLKGAFIHCTVVDDSDTRPLHLRNRQLRVTPKEVSNCINKLAKIS